MAAAMAEASKVLYTRGDAAMGDNRGESMVERHQRKIKAEKEAGAHAQLRMLIPDAGPALRTLALENCEWDVDRARTLIKRFREVKAPEIAQAKKHLAATATAPAPGAQVALKGKSDKKQAESESSGSSSDDSGDDASGGSDSDSRHKQRSHKRSHKSKKKSKRKEKSSSKSSKRKEKDEERDRDSRKAKRHKKEKKEKREVVPSSAALTQQFGKYGIIRESDYEAKRGDFQLWATEVKKVEIEVLPKWEEKELFKTFVEDFNTCTLPHKKYYDNDAYERARALKEAKSGKKSKSERTAFNDEDDRRKEAALLRAEEAEDRRKQAYNELRYTTNKAQEMREQEMLRQQMRMAYQTGNMDEARKLQERLNPDEDPNKP